jgi:hypothetical protein
MNILDTIAASEARPYIEELILAAAPSSEISLRVAEKFDVLFSPQVIEQYRQKALKDGNSPMQQIVKVTQDLANNDLPPLDELSKLSANFSFKKTNDDLELLYDRIRKLRKCADEEPEEASYDRRIKEYLAQAEAIRTRVFRHQYEQIRHAILLTVGKKLCTAAISILMPYIHKDHRQEAMRRFQAAIEPLLDMKSVPEMPIDVVEASEPSI